MIHPERITPLNNKKIRQNGDYILYWMQASQRTRYNHALEYAIKQANHYNKPLLVFFGLTDTYPDANLRHYHFLLEGLQEIQQTLAKKKIQLIIQHISPDKGIVGMADNAVLVTVDQGYLTIQKQWRHNAAENLHCPLIQIETDAIVPATIASSKEEYSAATIRPKIHHHLPTYLVPLPQKTPDLPSTNLSLPTLDITNLPQVLSHLSIKKDPLPVSSYQGGETHAQHHLTYFLSHTLDTYPQNRNDPSKNALSHMSPYLHFGHISPLDIALQVMAKKSSSAAAYLEELIIRRELSINFVHYNPTYDTYQAVPLWAQDTLKKHWADKREYIYTRKELEQANTHDPYWNAAQKEMMITGKMHGYMRMYWGKKIIEWTATPQEAYTTLLSLNNKYELDGRDPNGYTGVAWCFGKHDHPWQERPIFGKIRYMNARGLERKFPIKKYVEKIHNLQNQ